MLINVPEGTQYFLSISVWLKGFVFIYQGSPSITLSELESYFYGNIWLTALKIENREKQFTIL